MARQPRRETKKAKIDYMLTFGDMVTLLLCFFVATLSMANLEEKGGMKMTLSAFRGGLGMMESGPSLTEEKLATLGMEMDKLSPRKGVPGLITGRDAERGWRRHPFGDKIDQILKEDLTTKGSFKARYDGRGIIIQLSSQILFDSGSTVIKPTSKPILDRVAKLITALPNQIRIEGHTDNTPIEGREFPSNWELSVARAVNILHYLEEVHQIAPQRLSAVGYGSSRPISSNNTPEGRALNRRVDVVIIREEARREEPKTIN